VALIELTHVSRHYGAGDDAVHALEDVSLRIDAGEMLAIVGASGSGKSTLMNLLGCLDKPSAGSLTVDGRDVTTLSVNETAALRRETFGFIFQRYHLLGHLDALGNVALPAVYAGLDSSRRRARATALLQRLGLGERLGHKPHTLSGGQQQRVSIARALMNGGRIILADEPTGALDSASGAQLLALLGELNAQGHTIILVTHDPAVAAHAHRVVELRDGRIVRDEPTQARTRPAAASAPVASATPPPTRADRLAAWRESVAVSLAMLRSNRLRAALSMLGIGIGIAAVVGVMALGDGLQRKLEDNMDAMGAPTIDATVNGGLDRLLKGLPSQAFSREDAAALQALPGVAAARLQRSTMQAARHGAQDAFATVQAVLPGDLSRDRQVIVQGRDISELDLDTAASVAVLNQKALDALFPAGQPTLGALLMLGELPLTVVGVTEDRSAFGLGGMTPTIAVPEATYVARIDSEPTARNLRIYAAPGESTAGLMGPLRQTLLALHGSEDFLLRDGGQFDRINRDSLAGARQTLTAIATISLLVGGIGVMNIMLVSVAERTREIGIRMAIGARPADVRRQFLIESVVICGLGALVGLALPALAAQLTQWLDLKLPLLVGWRAVALALGASAAIGLVFGNLPAGRAARLSPVAALARD